MPQNQNNEVNGRSFKTRFTVSQLAHVADASAASCIKLFQYFVIGLLSQHTM
jgi:hypothetical protein